MVKRPFAVLVSVLAVVGAGGAPPPVRAVKILSPTFFPGWQARGVFHPFVLYDPRSARYTMYYSGSGTVQMSDAVSDTWVTGVATSRDGLHWDYPEDYEPVLLARRFLEGDMIDREGQSAVFDSLFAIEASVLRDGPVYRMWYTGWNGDTDAGRVKRVHFRIGLATSRDGVSWKKQEGAAGAGAVLGLGAPGEADAQSASHPQVLKEGATYRMWYACDDGEVHRICSASSSDGLAWQKKGAVLEPGGSGSPDERGLGNPVVIRRGGRHELWYQGRSRTEPNFHVLRATSAEGSAWTKAGEVALHPHPPVSGDEAVQVGSILVKADGACQVFFAKEITATRALAFGRVATRSFHIFSETVAP